MNSCIISKEFPHSVPINIIKSNTNIKNTMKKSNIEYGLKESCFNPNINISPPNKWNERLWKRIFDDYTTNLRV